MRLWLKCTELLFVISPVCLFYFLVCCLSSKPFLSALSNKSLVYAELDYKKQKRVKLPLTEKHRVYLSYLARMISFNNRRRRVSLLPPDHMSRINRNSNRKLMRKAALSGFIRLFPFDGLKHMIFLFLFENAFYQCHVNRVGLKSTPKQGGT